MSGYGEKVQFQIYSPEHSNESGKFPLAFEEWERLAKEKLEDGPYWYVAGGAGSGATMKANRDAISSLLFKRDASLKHSYK
ncbi:hypothetical protein RYX56_04800 [Alkalihalophilus lindianensis]|uniref:Uncharacterized protein n=1 Tax=Alkalihalophilus lindianensis TaxID=1630542 RepID=A0ABU3X749_9BACI|nr:hypothetical protein [Alkalihalophilus lindianensis]MDV2683694.1 hypothetical protein [Alkalihalophilus lindianensis]